MSRTEHTKRIDKILAMMFLENENPILDYGKRSDQEQNRLYRIGRVFDKDGNLISEDRTKTVTNCDGVKIVSGHQKGIAHDILFISDDGTKLLPAPKRGWAFWHQMWEKLGGQKEISWDEDHFEG